MGSSSAKLSINYSLSAAGAGADACEELSFINRVQKSVIHQKNRLKRKNNQKLRPLLRAIFAGKNAIIIQRISRNTHQIVANVTPNIVVANIMTPLSMIIY